jgi:hypothetical protein
MQGNAHFTAFTPNQSNIQTGGADLPFHQTRDTTIIDGWANDCIAARHFSGSRIQPTQAPEHPPILKTVLRK